MDRRDDAVVVRVDGDVDVSHTLELRDVLADAMDGGAASVVLDVGGVDFIDSAGVGLLVTAHRRAQGAGGAFLIADVTPTVARVLQLTRTDRLLDVHPGVDEALAALRSSPGA
ncbi:MAG: STAS domain-containing protein [Actinomycetota bacterium]|nr:STAS domain-containing protein [Actinomycetota bacterium]